MINILSALDAIDPSSLSYAEWIEIGMALKEAAQSGAGVGWKDWESWSRRDSPRFKEGECQSKWKSFNSSGITQGTLIRYALDNGYEPLKNRRLDWDDYISYDGRDPALDEFPLYINTLFKPGENIGICVNSVLEDGKYHPANNGFTKERDELLKKYRHYKGEIEYITGDYDIEAGGWIHFNPLDGKGYKSENVTDFRYCLVECDELPVDEQLKKIYSLRLPCAALVHSGKRSIHAIMHVDAPDKKTYTERVRWIYKVLTDNGFPVDESNKNPNRMSRFPGLKRGDKRQELLAVNTGYRNFAEWEEFVKNGLKDIELPAIRTIGEVWENPPELAPELIYGVLRQGHKMILSGPSKAGKSFSMIELGVAIAEGVDWMGFACRQGKVLYVNLEIDDASFINRVLTVYENMEIDDKHLDNFNFLTLRGKSLTIEQLASKVIQRAKDMNLSAIIIDPIYKIQPGDENSAGDIGRFTGYLDLISEGTGASVICSHHHSKGFQDSKRAIDRGSGSGVFTRDADAIIDMVELSREAFANMEGYDNVTAYKIEGVLREFESFRPFNVFFKYPLHEIDTKGILDDSPVLGSKNYYLQPKTETHPKTPEQKIGEKIIKIIEAYTLLTDQDGASVPFNQIVKLSGLSKRTIERTISEMKKLFKQEYFMRDGKGGIVVPDADIDKITSDINAK